MTKRKKKIQKTYNPSMQESIFDCLFIFIFIFVFIYSFFFKYREGIFDNGRIEAFVESE